MRKLRAKRLSNPLKVTQPVRGRTKTWTRMVWIQSLCFSTQWCNTDGAIFQDIEIEAQGAYETDLTSDN